MVNYPTLKPQFSILLPPSCSVWTAQFSWEADNHLGRQQTWNSSLPRLNCYPAPRKDKLKLHGVTAGWAYSSAASSLILRICSTRSPSRLIKARPCHCSQADSTVNPAFRAGCTQLVKNELMQRILLADWKDRNKTFAGLTGHNCHWEPALSLALWEAQQCDFCRSQTAVLLWAQTLTSRAIRERKSGISSGTHACIQVRGFYTEGTHSVSVRRLPRALSLTVILHSSLTQSACQTAHTR